MWLIFDQSTSDFQFVEKYAWIESGISYHLGIDGVSILFVILTTMLVPICILASYESIKFSVKEYLISFLGNINRKPLVGFGVVGTNTLTS